MFLSLVWEEVDWNFRRFWFARNCVCFFLLFERKWIETMSDLFHKDIPFEFLPLVWEGVDWNKGYKIESSKIKKFLSLVWEGADWNFKFSWGIRVLICVFLPFVWEEVDWNHSAFLMRRPLRFFFLLFERERIETLNASTLTHLEDVSFSCLKDYIIEVSKIPFLKRCYFQNL